ncbi:hypothetical protein HYPSUDRAFT_125785 [Hypholoma sublateritium FD-334 SS-4]|uniref:Cytochrome P450 n=1 Tax=Hypholoma sublateritium (strain FD-334 SS-4) TaxID=945553 RepID=A0A0D2PG27_HYPSF|nr:hypothetical protein HYPSUDRAFT_125785 [Hypholoma sublateritium FD-334 SS-4]
MYRRQKLRPRAFKNLPLPPGPKGLPLIGNLGDIPSSFEWLTYHRWCKEFDTDILHLSVAGTSFIILDTSEVTMDLFDKRSAIYSGKPRMPMVNELMGFDWNFSLMDYGMPTHHRRLMHQSFNNVAARQFRPYSLRSVRRLLRKILDAPDSDIMTALRRMAGETIMEITYGINSPSASEKYIDAAEEALGEMLQAGVPGAYMVDSWPFLKFIPEWVPGAAFQRKARECRKLTKKVLEAPFAEVMKQMAKGITSPCFTTMSLEKINQDLVADNICTEINIKSVAGTMYSAGTDTVICLSLISNCVLGLLSNPAALKEAQDQLDSVVKPGHLPDFEDEDSLPFITAIIKEGLRWNSIIPSVIHMLKSDDEYRGLYIPGGSIVIANTWAMLHNEEYYPDPFSFNPGRFIKDGKLDKAVRDPGHAIWGFGRRICPGRHMAFDQAWVAVASLIAVFDINKPVDASGNTIEPRYEYTAGLISKPKPFKASLTPRSKNTENLIRASNSHE